MASGWATMIAVISMSGIGRNSPRATPRRSILANSVAAAQIEVRAVEARHVGKLPASARISLIDAAQPGFSANSRNLATSSRSSSSVEPSKLSTSSLARTSGSPIASAITALKSSSLFLK